MAGEFIFSCGYVDVATGWTIYRSQWNKGMLVTQESLKKIGEYIPFPLRMIHPDCGTEFLNYVVMEWCEELQITVTRSRSYHKNDNGYIEQRNNHVVRKWFGYSRLEHKELVVHMNTFYEKLSLYANHFQAQRLPSRGDHGIIPNRRKDRVAGVDFANFPSMAMCMYRTWRLEM